MAEKYDAGFAFIVEGDTEKEFYLSFLTFLCRKHSFEMTRIIDETTPDVIYLIASDQKKILVKFHMVNAISQVPRAGKWFNAQCVDKYKKVKWFAILCYDTDKYTEDISKFHEGDWDVLHQNLKKATAILHVAAAADIEDIMLLDLDGICNFVPCEIPQQLKGRKGKIKLKNLFRDNKKAYHEGKRARPLIDSLNMQVIIERATVPLKEIEQLFFK